MFEKPFMPVKIIPAPAAPQVLQLTKTGRTVGLLSAPVVVTTVFTDQRLFVEWIVENPDGG